MLLDTLYNLVYLHRSIVPKERVPKSNDGQDFIRIRPNLLETWDHTSVGMSTDPLEEDGLFSRVGNSFWRESRNSEDRLERSSGSGNARVTHLVRGRCEVCVGHPLPSHWTRLCIWSPHTSVRPCTGRWLLSSKSVTSKITSHWSLDSSELTVPWGIRHRFGPLVLTFFFDNGSHSTRRYPWVL